MSNARDVIARALGGEEFTPCLPATPTPEAIEAMARASYRIGRALHDECPVWCFADDESQDAERAWAEIHYAALFTHLKGTNATP